MTQNRTRLHVRAVLARQHEQERHALRQLEEAKPLPHTKPPNQRWDDELQTALDRCIAETAE